MLNIQNNIDLLDLIDVSQKSNIPIRRMKARGLSVDEIAKSTNKTIEQVEEVLKEHYKKGINPQHVKIETFDALGESIRDLTMLISNELQLPRKERDKQWLSKAIIQKTQLLERRFKLANRISADAKRKSSIYKFLSESVVYDTKAEVGKKVLYQAYEKYCKRKDYAPVSKKMFGIILRTFSGLAIEEKRPTTPSGRRPYTWVGIRLKRNSPKIVK